MQKNDKSYTFLLSHSKKSGIYIKRFSISKALVHFGSLGVFLILGLTTLGIGVTGVVRNTVLAKNLTESPVASQIKAAPIAVAEFPEVAKPAPPVETYAFNSGGPEENEQVDGENTEIGNQIKVIEAKIGPDFTPSIWPHIGKINNEFGFRRNPFGGRSYEFHPGMDIDGQRGEEVHAPGGGTVIKASYTGGYGNMVEVDHGNGLTTRYGHMSKLNVSVGDTVKRGDLVGLIGSTGRSTGPHLHYELRLNDKSINPRHVLPPETANLPAK